MQCSPAPNVPANPPYGTRSHGECGWVLQLLNESIIWQHSNARLGDGMPETSISEEDLNRIFEDAKTKSGTTGDGLTPQGFGPVGACTAVTYGNPDQCRQLREAECRYVSQELEARNAGFAKWRPGNCDV